jgi:uncharacterized protein with HEPN domain
MKDDRFYLIQIAEDIERIQRFTVQGREAFMASELVQAAVLRCLQTMGESIKRLSEDLKTSYPDIPWHEIIGLRNVLVHDYLDIDLDEIWNIVELDLPVLQRQVQIMLS